MIRSSLRLASAAVALGVFVALPSLGQAADYTPPPAPELRPSDWTGPFIGGVAAVDCMETHYVPSQGPDPDLNGCGWLGGVIAGWNYQAGSWVLGIEGDASWGGQTGENSLDAVKYDVDLFATVRARVGWLPTEQTLFYITGGVAWLDGTMDALVGPGSVPQSDSNTHVGWTVGGGIEHAFTDSFHARLEYLFASFNDKEYDLTVPGQCVAPCVADLKFDELHAVRLGLTWNFGSIFR